MRRSLVLAVAAAGVAAVYAKSRQAPRLGPADVGVAEWAPLVAVARSVPVATTGSSQPVDGTCPAGFPIKGKNTSKIYHSPGGRNYERTVADVCFVDAAAAEAAGFRAPKS